MKKNQLKKIYKALSKIRKHDEKVDKKLHEFLDAISPSTRHFAIVDNGKFEGAKEMLKLVYGEHFDDDVSYWFYECMEGKERPSGLGPLTGTTNEGEEFEFSSLENYLNWLMKTADYVGR